MKEESITDALLREFLLGTVADEEQERIENLFLTDPDMKERVFAIEQELVDDYLENSLTPEDKERFVSRYARTDEQRRTLRISKSIRDWAVTEAKAPQPAASSGSILSRLAARLRLNPRLIVPIAVTTVVVVVVAILLLNSFIEQRRRFAIQQELARLNSPESMREIPSQMVSLELRPGTVRSDAQQAELNKGPSVRFFELRLVRFQETRYSTYRVEVRRVGGDEEFTIPNLQAADEGGNVIRVRLSEHMLKRGHYLINLTGIANDGALGQPEEYSFAVSD